MDVDGVVSGLSTYVVTSYYYFCFCFVGGTETDSIRFISVPFYTTLLNELPTRPLYPTLDLYVNVFHITKRYQLFLE